MTEMPIKGAICIDVFPDDIIINDPEGRFISIRRVDINNLIEAIKTEAKNPEP